MSTQSEKLTAIANAIREKEGSSSPIVANDFPARILAIETGIQLPTLTNPGNTSDLLNGKQLIDQNGEVLTGSMPTTETPIPSIIVQSNGLITTQVTQGAGYTPGGTQSNTKYISSTDCPNLIASNIKKGVNIFGVVGNFSGGEYDFTIVVSNGSGSNYLQFQYNIAGRSVFPTYIIVTPEFKIGNIPGVSGAVYMAAFYQPIDSSGIPSDMHAWASYQGGFMYVNQVEVSDSNWCIRFVSSGVYRINARPENVFPSNIEYQICLVEKKL